jgi:DNA-binding NarL/FixJ family response regulator
MAIKIFIVDDHYMVIEGIRSLLQQEKHIEWMGHAMNASSCLGFLKLQLPDVILMDVNLPDRSGTDLCKEVKQLYPHRSLNALNTVGYKELFDFMDGKSSLEEAVNLIKQNTRRYAKRQLTWFNHQGDFEPFEPDEAEKIKAYIEILTQHL